MAILGFLLNLAGATMLLLFAVRMVRTGIERSFGASFQRVITDQKSLMGASATGLGLAVVLQSSAAVALLVAGFSTGGGLVFATGLAVVLGGDLGSAIKGFQNSMKNDHKADDDPTHDGDEDYDSKE